MKDNNKQVALVTGANGGIGKAICEQLASQGLDIITVGRSKSGLDHPHHLIDMSDLGALDSLESISKVDVVVHAASVCPSSPLLSAPISQFNLVYTLNVLCPLRLLQLFAPKMLNGGSFIFISSINGSRACPNLGAYSASKAALNNLTQTAAEELAERNIRVNAVAPASIDTPMLTAGFDSQPNPQQAREKNALRHPLARIGKPEDVAHFVSFLASEKANWITGGIHFVDGGAHITRR